jgi:hypothetical protein
MEGCAEPLGLGIGGPDHRSDHHRGRCQNRRKSSHKELPPFTVRNWGTTCRQYRDFGIFKTDLFRGTEKSFGVVEGIAMRLQSRISASGGKAGVPNL